MSSFNQVNLLGRVGQDPEVHMSANNNKVVTFALATNQRWKDRTSGEKKERTDWHRCVAFGRAADTIENYVTKGDLLMITGVLTSRSYQTQSGETRWVTEVNVRGFELMPNTRPTASAPTAQAPTATTPASTQSTAAQAPVASPAPAADKEVPSTFAADIPVDITNEDLDFPWF
ncbi:single-stranded DNA-binding protein [Moraxella sp. ZJ142]|uniref:single-stranded DNA-binding protein n=1 Tax=Moraxella marmotae TaxID=3344520 RepID=UPI0035D3ECB6